MLKSTTKSFRSEPVEAAPSVSAPSIATSSITTSSGSALSAKRSIDTPASNGKSPVRNGQAAPSSKTLVPPRTSLAAGPDARSGFARPIATPAIPPAGNEPALKTQSQVAPILIVDDEPFVADLIYHWVHS